MHYFCDTALQGYFSRTSAKDGKLALMPRNDTALSLVSMALGTAAISNCYVGLYNFPSDVVENYKAGKELKDYSGAYTADYIYHDIDRKIGAIHAIPVLISVIEHIWKYSSQFVFFTSGKKGFQIRIPAGMIGWEPHPQFAEIARNFTELLYPAGKVGSGDEVWIDAAVFEKSRLDRLPCSQNLPNNQHEAAKDGDLPRGFKIELSLDEISQIRSHPESLYELWRFPNNRSVSYNHLTGSVYWEYTRVPALQELWERARKLVENGPSKPVPVTRSFSTGRTEIHGSVPRCIANIITAIDRNDESVLGQRRHLAFWNLTGYYFQQYKGTEIWRTLVLGLNNQLQSPLPEPELDNIFRAFATGNGGFPCGKPNVAQSPVSFCGMSCQHTSNWLDMPGLYERTREYLLSGPTPYKIGYPKVDDLVGGFSLRSMLVWIAYPGVGKTTLNVHMFRFMCERLLALNEGCMFFTPEESLSTVGTYFAMQLGKHTLQDLYDQASNGSALANEKAWFERHTNAFVADSRRMSVKQIAQNITEVEQRRGIKIRFIVIDNATFIRPDNNLIRGENYAEKNSLDLDAMTHEHDLVASVCVHLRKPAGKNGEDIVPRDFTDKRPSVWDAMGTSYWAGISNFLGVLYTKGPHVVMVSIDRAKRRISGGDLPHPFPLLRKQHFSLYTLQDAQAMQDPESYFPHVNLPELVELEAYGSGPRKPSITGLMTP